MEIITMPLGVYETNCHIIINGQNAIVVDPADNAMSILKILDERGAHLSKILLTHGHLDHVLGCADLCAESGAKVFMHRADYPMVSDIAAALPQEPGFINRFTPITGACFVEDGGRITDDGLNIDVLHTPGHSPGSVMYLLHDERVIFTGDTVFYMTIGRSETIADFKEMLNSIEKIIKLEDDYTLFPGHGQQTTLSFEIANNPYFNHEL